jgi:hypothetical protein
VSRKIALVAAVAATAVGLSVPAATASRGMLIGLLDEANTLYGTPETTFPVLRQLKVKALRVNLYWGGRFGVASERPANPTNPNDPAYDWAIYDRTVQYAAQYGIKMVFSIYGTPGWANGHTGLNHAPTKAADLQRFAYAAARRYSGTSRGEDNRRLPSVRLWLAWTEPNNPINLFPQYKRVRGRWVVQSAIDYARICNAIYNGIHSTSIAGEKVACGVTAPRGNNVAGGLRSSVSPIAFLRAAKRAGMRRFDAYAHHPYSLSKREGPTTPPANKNAVTLGNINTLIKEIDRLYGGRKPLWITEYGYQTNPPDRVIGVPYALQARWLTKAYAVARANRRITMMLWFLLKDEPNLGGWQSGFLTVTGKKKPSFLAFQRLPR